ncbi:MAG: hypothetical protein MUF54_19730, partial [Polyangiaceae bacterium]|nr:hypothetical protein [Polyangiaceae bacterium]
MSSASRKLVSVGLFLLIVTISVAIAAVLIKTHPEPKQTEQAHKGEPVQTYVLNAASHLIQVIAQGSVVAAEEVVIQPEVTGRVVWVSPQMVPGGRVKKGTPLLRIDASDYAAAVQQQLAQVESQRLALDQEQGRRIIAEREWELFGDAGAPDAAPD